MSSDPFSLKCCFLIPGLKPSNHQLLKSNMASQHAHFEKFGSRHTSLAVKMWVNHGVPLAHFTPSQHGMSQEISRNDTTSTRKITTETSPVNEALLWTGQARHSWKPPRHMGSVPLLSHDPQKQGPTSSSVGQLKSLWYIQSEGKAAMAYLAT